METPPTRSISANLLRELTDIVGPDHIVPAGSEYGVDGVVPEQVIEPGTADQVGGVLKLLGAAGVPVLPRGSATKMDWGNPPRGGQVVLSTRRMNRVIEHAWGDMTATVESGCVFSRLQTTLADHGQRLALDPLWPGRATIGGILATNDSGSLRARFGSLRDLVIGVTLALPDGTLARSGGKVVKNVAGYDLPKLATGSLGTLGIITQAIFRLHPISPHVRTLSFAMRDEAHAAAVVLAVHDSNLVPAGVQIRAGSHGAPQLDVRFEGPDTGCDAQAARLLTMVSGASEIDPQVDVWNSEGLWQGLEPAAVCRVSLLPGEIGSLLKHLGTAPDTSQFRWRTTIQGVGVGLCRIEATGDQRLAENIGAIRRFLEERSGSLAILRCLLPLKRKIEVWGNPGDALPLMRRIKLQFDPGQQVNPGRYVGGI